MGVMDEFVRKTTDEMIAVMQAEKSGKTIQEKHLDKAEWVDVQFPCGWNWVSYDYRVKPVEPRRTLWLGVEYIELTPEVRKALNL